MTNPWPTSPQFLHGNERSGIGHVIYRWPLRLQFVHVHSCNGRQGKVISMISKNEGLAHRKVGAVPAVMTWGCEFTETAEVRWATKSPVARFATFEASVRHRIPVSSPAW